MGQLQELDIERYKIQLAYWEQVKVTSQSDAMRQKADTMIKIIQESLRGS